MYAPINKMKLEVKPIPVPRGNQHPPVGSDILPRHEFSMGLIAPKGSGKTTLIANLLQFYKGYFHTIIVFSPTVNADDKWDYLKQLPLLGENTKLKKWIKDISAAQIADDVVQPSTPSGELEGLVNPSKMTDFRIPENCFFSEYTEEELVKIMDEQSKMIQLLQKFGQSKHLANRILIIFDDLVGSSLFGNQRNNPFKMLNTNHRHYTASMLLVSQAYKELPKTVRTNLSCLIVFEIPNEKEIEVIYEENPVFLKRDDWMELYSIATSGDHDFLFINYQKPRHLRLMKNFTHVLWKE